jgi:hypothetical protein
MSRKAHRVLIGFSMALGFMLLLSGCDLTPNAGGDMLAVLSSASDELATFVQEFTREALAAFLY